MLCCSVHGIYAILCFYFLVKPETACFSCKVGQNRLFPARYIFVPHFFGHFYCVKGVRIQSYDGLQNADQNNSEDGHFLRSVLCRLIFEISHNGI